MNFGQPDRPPIKTGTRVTIDAKTGEITEVVKNAMTLLPPHPDACQICGVDHPHDLPHNMASLYYRIAFAATHGREPTWTDAMAHCPDQTKKVWRQELRADYVLRGINIPDDLKNQGESP